MIERRFGGSRWAWGNIYTQEELNVWIVILFFYIASEIRLDIYVEFDRINMDHERIGWRKVLEIVLLQFPKMMLYALVIMPARLYGTLTYPWRKMFGDMVVFFLHSGGVL